jgi:GNAT superfamily N-acetyltransferase
MIIRAATRADVPRVVELLQQMSIAGSLRELPGAARYDEAFAAIQADPRQTLYVVERDGVVVATATYVLIPNLSHVGRPIAQVESVVVDAAARGAGIGAALMRFLIDQAKRAGAARVQLTSNAARTDAHRFYERLGFVASHVGFKLPL